MLGYAVPDKLELSTRQVVQLIAGDGQVVLADALLLLLIAQVLEDLLQDRPDGVVGCQHLRGLLTARPQISKKWEPVLDIYIYIYIYLLYIYTYTRARI